MTPTSGTTKNQDCLGGKVKKIFFAEVNSSFADVFEENYLKSSTVFAASKQIWITKTDERDIPTSFENMCTSMWVNCKSVDIFLSFLII